MHQPSRNLSPILYLLACVGAAIALRPTAELVAEAAPVRPYARADGPVAAADASRVRYDRDIRPILSDRCFQCHGPDAAKRKAELRLDLSEEAHKVRDGDIAAFIAGKPLESEAFIRMSSSDDEERMPPPRSNKLPLTPDQREMVRRWIEQGAAYEPHWSFVPPTRPASPQVAGSNWARNGIDLFVLAGLEHERVEPAPAADPPTLLRRVFLDLTGLPPTPEELDGFLSDSAPDAYERWVDRLLTTEPYRTRLAERLASPWLDAARYADTNGIHTDAGRQIWPYRDWVLAALRDDMPFDRFITEQLAGDLLEHAGDAEKIATGFNRCHVMTDEGGAIAEEYLAEYAADRASTTSSVFLGLTVGCARCHDHKFDPITTEDFYSLTAFFNSVEEPGLYSQLPDSNRAFEPFMTVPDAPQRAALDELSKKTEAARAEFDRRDPADEAALRSFLEETPRRAGVAWAETTLAAATSGKGATVTIEPGNIAAFSGANPDDDEHELTLRSAPGGSPARLILVEALPDPATNRPGRFSNGNAVVTSISASVPDAAGDPREIPLIWAWADLSQSNGDFNVTNVLGPPDDRGWALDGHNTAGGRVALLLAAEPFDVSRGVRVRFEYHSVYKQHTLARIRVRLGSMADTGPGMLPVGSSRWQLAGPFTIATGEEGYGKRFGPEEGDALDFKRNFGFGNQYWRFAEAIADGRVSNLGSGTNVTYVGKMVYAPGARELSASLGSDDGFQFYVNGAKAGERRIDRSVAPDQDKAQASLRAGANAVVLKVINTGGDGGSFFRATDDAELSGDLPLALLPEEMLTPERRQQLEREWRGARSPRHKELSQMLADLAARREALDKSMPRTMVMKELPKPRETFVLTRGQYDHPDKARPVTRRIPASLGALPEGAPADRRGLAQWLTGPQNPLTARIAVNRMWELLFGAGLVRTSEDFGLQGEWPSHPELLDWLAVEFRDSGWRVSHMLRLMVTSSTYRQSSRFRPELAERDPDNRLMARYPSRRLTAEQVRDQALYVSGLLVEVLGGPSVKPYQPEGLWQEVAMPASNTKEYVRGEGKDLYRRSLYTYWKRAVPPPSMATFDAPTRESCVVRRTSTNTPLQALVLWNDEQFVEAARVLAARVLRLPSDTARLNELFRRCTAREPNEDETGVLLAALADFRATYKGDAESASMLVSKGDSPVPEGVDRSELAAWTMMASAVMNLHETVVQR